MSKRKRPKQRRRHSYGPSLGSPDQRTAQTPRREADTMRMETPYEQIEIVTGGYHVEMAPLEPLPGETLRFGPAMVVNDTSSGVPTQEICDSQYYRGAAMATEDDLSKVKDTLKEISDVVDKVIREKPAPVARRFRVRGLGVFPLDMLRYDNCVPDEEPDVKEIYNSIEEEANDINPRPHFVTLRKLSAGDPSYQRWRSMGWHVEE